MRSISYLPQILTVFAISAASAAQSPWGFPLERVLVVTSINGQSVTEKAPTLTVAPDAKENKLRGSGFGGCNRWFGQITLNQTEFAVEHLGATKMYCASKMTDEANFLTTLKTVKRWRMNGAAVVLEGDQTSVVLSPAASDRL
jgi:heat shock protein HslJ